jgi:radical SAM superfamily enzyme
MQFFMWHCRIQVWSIGQRRKRKQKQRRVFSVTDMLELRCPKHTGYKGINQPPNGCTYCQMIRDIRFNRWYLVKNIAHGRKRRLPTQEQIALVEEVYAEKRLEQAR